MIFDLPSNHGENMRAIFITIAALGLGQTSTAFAQDVDDVLKWTAQDLVFEADPSHTEEFHKYHFFHKSGVSYDQAVLDFGECNVFRKGPVGKEGETFHVVPQFVSLSETQSYRPYVYNPNSGGVVGAVIGEIVGAPIIQKAKAQRMRKCMEYKGYDRYGLSKKLWKRIMKVEDADLVRINASIASGPKPKTEKLLP